MSAVLYLLPNRVTEMESFSSIPEATLVVARSCRRFLAENAKSARAYIKSIQHPTPISELEIIEIGHEPDAAKFDEWLKPVVDGIDTAIVSESGCPGVADPGAGLVARAHDLGLCVRPLVGPCSILMTLMASGMNGQRFRFLGYLPIDDGERASTLKNLEAESRRFGETELFIETPYRNNKMLSAMLEVLSPDTRITVATDVTGGDENILTKTVADWKKSVPELPKLPTVFALLGTGRGTQSHSSNGKSAHKPARHKPFQSNKSRPNTTKPKRFSR